MTTYEGVTQLDIPRFILYGRKAYWFYVLLTKDTKTGVFSAVALNLPGVGSCGDTPDDAIENFKEAAGAAMEVYDEDGQTIPWKDVETAEIPFGSELRRIVVHA